MLGRKVTSPLADTAPVDTALAGTERAPSGPGRPPATPDRVSSPTPVPFSVDRWSGTDLDHYHVQKPLGRGGMGQVFLADDQSLDRRVAIKILPEHLYGNKEIEARFLREAQAQARLASPNVVAIHHIGRLPNTATSPGSNGGLYFAMELVDGEPLEAILQRKSMLHPEEARLAMLHVARGLRDAHRAGIIHRDIKPSNLLRDQQGWVKIADFGIAKVTHAPKDDRRSLTQEGVVLGTPVYMSPEQAAGETLDFRSDMYSLGCTFYHLIVGEPPFDGTNGLHVAAQHISSTPRPIEQLVRDISPALAAVFHRLLQKKRDQRYATYDDLIAALEAAAPEAVAYAGFWARGSALLLDVIIAGTLVGLFGWPGVIVQFVYVTIGHAYFGRTLPKWMLSMRVTKRDGTRLGLPRALLRTVSSMWLPLYVAVTVLVTQGASNLRLLVEHLEPRQAAEARSIVLAVGISNGILTLLWMAGIAMALFNAERRALHDVLSGSRVTYAFRRISMPSPPPRAQRT